MSHPELRLPLQSGERVPARVRGDNPPTTGARPRQASRAPKRGTLAHCAKRSTLLSTATTRRSRARALTTVPIRDTRAVSAPSQSGRGQRCRYRRSWAAAFGDVSVRYSAELAARGSPCGRLAGAGAPGKCSRLSTSACRRAASRAAARAASLRASQPTIRRERPRKRPRRSSDPRGDTRRYERRGEEAGRLDLTRGIERSRRS